MPPSEATWTGPDAGVRAAEPPQGARVEELEHALAHAQDRDLRAVAGDRDGGGLEARGHAPDLAAALEHAQRVRAPVDRERASAGA